MMTDFALASPQTETQESPAQSAERPPGQVKVSVDFTVKDVQDAPPAPPSAQEAPKVGQTDSTADDSKGEAANAEAPSDLLFVITREGLNQLIEASGGDIQAFDLSRLKNASSLVPLSANQSEALRPVLQTAASPIMLDRLFHPANIKVIQSFLGGAAPKVADSQTDSEKLKTEQRDKFFEDHPWINDPGIGQFVAVTGMIEADRPDEIAARVREKIREGVAKKVQGPAKERFGVDEVDPALLKESFFDPGKIIVQSAPWEENTSADGSRDGAMVKTYVLVKLPSTEIESVMVGIKGEIQKERLALVCITVGLAWLGIALSSIAFRTFHTESRFWKLVVIPVLSIAVIPCLVLAGVLIGEMATGQVL